MTTNRTPTERQLNKIRIAEDKARATRWASRRRSLRNQNLPVAATAVEVSVPVQPPERSVLQDLIARRTALIQELKEVEIAIAVIERTYAH